MTALEHDRRQHDRVTDQPLEDYEHAMDLMFHSLESTHEHTRTEHYARLEREAGDTIPTTERS